MGDPVLAPLPKGRHQLSRQEVQDAQRIRLAVGMAEEMAESGYVGTPVAAVLKRARVSRQTFYELYDDKHACFLDALDLVGAVLLADLRAETAPGDPLDRARTAVDAYLDTIVRHRAFARLFLVEVHAAGEEAMARRAALQDEVVDGLADLLGAVEPDAGFACRAYVAAIASLVTLPVVTGDEGALDALRAPLLGLLEDLAERI
ncbi:MAG TPA: TetR/AcrR family transcriptional regulator [Acidimicrobiales bacterium]|nr:TetR/AcrR family transcriptional regulator [Acidimicrobiales bacterium]